MYQVIKAIPESGSIKMEITRTKEGNVQVFLMREFPDAKVPLHPMLVVAAEDEIKDELNAAIRVYRVGTDSIVQQVEHALAASQKAADKKVAETDKASKPKAEAGKVSTPKADAESTGDVKADKPATSSNPTSPDLEGAAGLFS